MEQIVTYRSIKAIQSKIYQMKPEFEKDLEIMNRL